MEDQHPGRGMNLIYQNAKILEALISQHVTLLTFFVKTLLARDKMNLEVIEGAIEQSQTTLAALSSSLRTNAPQSLERILENGFERIEVNKAIFGSSDEDVEGEKARVRDRHNAITCTFSENLLNPLEKHVKAVAALHEEALLAFSKLEDRRIANVPTSSEASTSKQQPLYRITFKL